MSNIKLISIVIFVILVLTSLNFQFSIEDSKDNYGNSNLEKDDEIHKPDYRGFRGRSVQLENNVHGGSWRDSFEDDLGIDWGMSDNIKFFNKDIIMRSKPKVDTNTMGLWYFDEGSGITAYDETTNDNDGTLGGNGVGTDLPIWVNGKFGKALDFDGADDWVDCGNDATLKKQRLTLYAVVKPTSLASTKNRFIIDGGTNGCVRGYSLVHHKENRFNFCVRTSDSVFGFAKSSTTVEVDKYYCVVGTYDGSKVKIYVNGNLETSVSFSNSITYLSESINFGRYITHQNQGYDFNGIIDEVWISDIARVPTRYSANLTSKKIDIPTNLHWDTLLIDKTQPQNAFLNITILNATNNQRIPGSPIYTNGGEFDISYIDPIKYPSIKLNASFFGNDFGLTPTLHHWGVSWNRSNTWRDTLFGGVKVSSKTNVDVAEGLVEFQDTGSLISTRINIPDKYYYDKLLLNKIEPSGGSLKITIVDAPSGAEITGFKDLTETLIDLSTIDPLLHPAIKLKATYSSPGQIGTINDWSVNWTRNQLPNILNVNSVPAINRTYGAKITMNSTDLEELENELTLEVEYKSPSDLTWQTEYLSNLNYVNDYWECIFMPHADAELGNFTFKVTCTDQYLETETQILSHFIEVCNNDPIILNIDPEKLEVKRTETIEITIDAIDIEINEENLDINIQHKSPQTGATWETNYITHLNYLNDNWVADFSPPKNAVLGTYIFHICCSDLDSEVIGELEIEVQNNKATKPDVILKPSDPKTNEDLMVLVGNSTDVETPVNKLEFWYHWYKDNTFIPEFENTTTIPNIATSKGETWRCQVYPFDGDEPGIMGEAQVNIQNVPPVVVATFENIVLFEDSSIVLEEQLITIFDDLDNDNLTYSIYGQENIIIDIIQQNGTIILNPVENWFGIEYITFYANDTFSTAAEVTVQVTVKPTNDLPVITQIGSQMVSDTSEELYFIVSQNKLSNLTLYVEDIDGDEERGLIKYILNISENRNLYFNESETSIIFNPTNDEVGWHYIKIRITDNNETPLVYVSQDIQIEVLNVNDPPSVKITAPQNNYKFNTTDKIQFTCIGTDPDLLISNTEEKLTFRWFINGSNMGDLGTGSEFMLAKHALTPGFHNITVEVTDSADVKAYDYVQVIIKKAQRETTGTDMTGIYISLIILIIIILIIIGLVLFLNTRKRKMIYRQDFEEYQDLPPPPRTPRPPYSKTGRPPTPTTQPIPRPQPETESRQTQQTPQARLAPVVKTPEQKPEIKSNLNLDAQKRLELLDERLLRGEIDQKLYMNLKAKYEMDAKDNQPK